MKSSARALGAAVVFFALINAGGCDSSGSGDSTTPDATTPPSDSGTVPPPDAETPPASNTDGDAFGGGFPIVQPSENGKLYDNLAGVWMTTEETTSHYATLEIPRLTTHSITRSIVRIYPYIDGSESNPFIPGTPAAKVSCGTGAMFVSQDPNTTQATYVDNFDTTSWPALTIVNDTRMERDTDEGHIVWQKINVPTDENGDPIIGTVAYDASGSKTFSGTTNISCLLQVAAQTAEGDDASSAPLLLSHLQLASNVGGTIADKPIFNFSLSFGEEPSLLSSIDALYVFENKLTPDDSIYDQTFNPALDNFELTADAPVFDAISTSATNDGSSISISWQLNH